MIVRRMEEKDIAEVALIEQAIFPDPWSANSFLVDSMNKNNIYLVAQDRGEIVGYCGLWGVAGEGQVTNVAVRTANRRQGIAKQLLTNLIQIGKEMGLESFTLEVRVSNTNAIKLYELLGFYSVGKRKDFYTHPNEDAIIMWL